MAKKKGARSVPAQLAIGGAAELGFLLVLTAIASALVLRGVIGQGSVQAAGLCANALAAFAGSLIAARGFSQRKLLYTLACTAGYLLLLLFGNLLFVSAPPDGMLWVAAPALAASALACLLVNRKPKRGRRYR